MRARAVALAVLAVIGCARHPPFPDTKTIAPGKQQAACPPIAPDSKVQLAIVGDIPDPSMTSAIAAALCPRLDELAYCISIAHGSAPEERGTIDVFLGLTSGGLKRVVVTGGSLGDRYRDCVVDALEVTHGVFPHAISFTINVVAGPVPPPPPTTSAPTPLGRLPPSLIKQRIRDHFPRFRACYERGLDVDPTCTGTVAVRFIIEPTGAVRRAEISEGSTLADPNVRACVLASYRRLAFPRPVGGAVMVTYPIAFTSE